MFDSNSWSQRRMCEGYGSTDRAVTATSSHGARWVGCLDEELLKVVQKVEETHWHILLTSLPCNITYHLSRSALMMAQAAGTGASAGAAAVSESDMSVVVLWVLRMCVLSCSCPPNAYGSQRRQQRQRETVEMRASWWEGREHRRRWEEIKHVRGQHTCICSRRGQRWRGTRVRGQWPRGERLGNLGMQMSGSSCCLTLTVLPLGQVGSYPVYSSGIKDVH